MGYRAVPPIVVSEDPAVRGYLAGIVDGEGYIGIHRSWGKGSRSFAYSIRVIIANTDARLIEWIQRAIQTDVKGIQMRGGPQGRWKPRLSIQLTGANAEALIRAVRPYLVIKGEQADIALRFRDERASRYVGKVTTGRSGCPIPEAVSEQREAWRQELLALNRKGPKPTTE